MIDYNFEIIKCDKFSAILPLYVNIATWINRQNLKVLNTLWETYVLSLSNICWNEFQEYFILPYERQIKPTLSVKRRHTDGLYHIPLTGQVTISTTVLFASLFQKAWLFSKNV